MADPVYLRDKEQAYLDWLVRYLTQKLATHITPRATAEALGVDPANLYRLMRKVGIKPLPRDKAQED